MTIVRTIDNIEAPSRYLFTEIDVKTTFLLKDMKLYALAISKRIKVTNAVVLACSKPWLNTLNNNANTIRVIIAMDMPAIPNHIINDLFKIPFFLLGFSFIMSFDEGVNDKVSAGKSSVTKFINNICKASKIGTCQPNNGDSKTPKNKIVSSA